jgi:hypothetical protein
MLLQGGCDCKRWICLQNLLSRDGHGGVTSVGRVPLSAVNGMQRCC